MHGTVHFLPNYLVKWSSINTKDLAEEETTETSELILSLYWMVTIKEWQVVCVNSV